MSLLELAYDVLQNIAKVLGFNLAVSRRKEGVLNTLVFPAGIYTPWEQDSFFQETYKKIKRNTLVDEYRCYELWQLVAEVSKLKGVLIEIGVWKGGTGAIIAQRAKLLGIKDTIYLCDTFKGSVKTGPNDSFYEDGEHADTSKNLVENLIHERLKLDNVKILEGIFPEQSSKFINENCFRFCHIDVDVYQSAKDCVDYIWPKLVIGGIIVYDDYGFSRCDGITKFVDEERKKSDRIVIHNLNGHAIVVKIS